MKKHFSEPLINVIKLQEIELIASDVEVGNPSLGEDNENWDDV